MFKKLNNYRALVKQYGLRRCSFRFFFDLRRKYGLLRRKFPPWRWEEKPLAAWLKREFVCDADHCRQFRQNSKAQFFFPLGQPPLIQPKWVAEDLRRVEALLKGEFQYFSFKNGKLGYPQPNWFKNPFTGQQDSAKKHWCDRVDFDPSRGDIKYIWEPSRFAWAYSLARAYAANPKDEYAQAFWLLLESWLAANPPQMGPNWQCGQEVAIRTMACVFAAHTFWNSPATNDKRISSLMVLVAASAQRIAANIKYAQVQMSNHAVTEAAGLWTAALLFPEFKQASAWQKLAKNVLEDEIRRYNFPDGSYIQHSMNYQRMTLQNCLWCFRLGEINDNKFSDLAIERVKKSYEFLYQLQDPQTGRVPNYGPNDGANTFPVNSCDYLDYRPAIAAAHFFLTGERLYDNGPWDENLLWFFGPEALDSPLSQIDRTSRDFPDGGYFTLRAKQSWAMTRCYSYRTRPNQADMLHLDLWWRGINVLRDSGTFTYYDPKQNWHKFFVSTFAHNTIALGGVDQMIKADRFRWHSLVQSRFIEHEGQQEQFETWQGEHYGYKRLPSKAICRRMICRIDDTCWLIVDDILGRGSEKATILWNFPDVDCSLDGNVLNVSTSKGLVAVGLYCSANSNKVMLSRGEDSQRRLGWQSLYYGQKTPTPTLYMDVYDSLPIRFISLISLGQGFSAQSDGHSFIKWSLDGNGSVQARLSEMTAGNKTSVVLQYGSVAQSKTDGLRLPRPALQASQ